MAIVVVPLRLLRLLGPLRVAVLLFPRHLFLVLLVVPVDLLFVVAVVVLLVLLVAWSRSRAFVLRLLRVLVGTVAGLMNGVSLVAWISFMSLLVVLRVVLVARITTLVCCISLANSTCAITIRLSLLKVLGQCWSPLLRKRVVWLRVLEVHRAATERHIVVRVMRIAAAIGGVRTLHRRILLVRMAVLWRWWRGWSPTVCGRRTTTRRSLRRWPMAR